MKKLIPCVVIGLSIAAVSYAGDAGDLWLGVRAGPSVPRLSGGGNEISRGYDSIVAPNGGLVADYFLTSGSSLLIEVDYSGQGGERKGLQPITQTPQGLPDLPPGQLLYGDFKNKSILNYLEIPVMGKCEWGSGEHWRCFVEAGPYVGYLLNAKEESRGTSQIYVDQQRTPLAIDGQPLPPMSFDASTNVKSDLHRINAGITAGIGTAYLFNANNQVFLDLRGEYGLTTIQKDTFDNGSSHTGNAVLSLGYKVRFGPGSK